MFITLLKQKRDKGLYYNTIINNERLKNNFFYNQDLVSLQEIEYLCNSSIEKISILLTEYQL